MQSDSDLHHTLKHHTVLRTVIRFLLPFLLMYGFYIQIHGEESPGGGFQAGVLVAAAFMLHSFVYGARVTLTAFPMRAMYALACLGILLYGGTGVLSLLHGGNYLDYRVLNENPVVGQKLGIIAIEWGVGFTVCGVMLLIFYCFMLAKEKHP